MLKEGARFGDYTVVRPLGKGGMGEVWLLEGAGGGQVAAKILDPATAGDHKARKRFVREAQLALGVKHPNLVESYDVGEDPETGLCYILMEYVSGGTLADLIREEGALPIDDAVVVVEAIASVLELGRQKGIVHRDIKPANIMFDAEGTPKLADLGIARRGSGGDDSSTDVTKTGAMIGTPAYMAPEQMIDARSVDTRADIYSLGVVFYEMLTGERPNKDDTVVQLMAKALRGEPLPDVRTMRPEVSASLAQLIGMMVAPDKDGRISTPGQITTALSIIERGGGLEEVISTVTTPPPRRPGKSSRIRPPDFHDEPSRFPWKILVPILILGALGGGLYAWQHVTKRDIEHDRQVAELQRLIRERDEAQEKARAEAEAKAKGEGEAKAKGEGEGEEKAKGEGEGEGEEKAKDEGEGEEKAKGEGEEKSKTKGEGKAKGEEVAPLVIDAAKPSMENRQTEPKRKREFVVDETVTQTKNYGPIPNRTYKWFTGVDRDFPQSQTFLLANNARLELVAFEPRTVTMMNRREDLRGWHRAKITRPFWMSRSCLTVDQWREFAPNDCDDCREAEKALGGRALLYIRRNRRQCDAYCKYLSEKYARQLPKGYVFRLPTEAELQLAKDFEGTYARYHQPRVKDWREFVSVRGETVRKRFEAIRNGRKDGPLGKFESDGNWPNTCYGIGGLALPSATGIVDLFGAPRWMLDIVPDRQGITHAESETDPLWWCEGGLYDDRKAWGLTFDWESDCSGRRFSDNWAFHLVLGPDLIAEKAWKNERKDVEVAVQIPGHRSRLDPKKIPGRVVKPREVALRRVGGKTMTFCEIPKGRFNMTNVRGQEQGYHKCEITRPFWMSKFLVTTDEWREYAPSDYDTRTVRTAERTFLKYPICVRNTYARWTAYCEFLTKRYAALLPPGYVFRLPTEAEWEWAFIADTKGDARRMRYEHCNEHEPLRREFDSLLRQIQMPKWVEPDPLGTFGPVFVGGRTKPTGFGVIDMVVHCRGDVAVLDTFDASGGVRDDGSIDWRWADVAKNIVYANLERDPIRFVGKASGFFEVRSMGDGRGLRRMRDGEAYAHIVIAPDVLAPLKAREVAEFPLEDFKGVYIGEGVKRADQSSMHDGNWRNSEKQFKRMVSRESVIVAHKDRHEETYGFHTKWEDDPWIQLDLGRRRTVTGLAIDGFLRKTQQLCIWTSDDGRHERLVDCESLERERYRIDLNGKNVTCRYIRIGRKPGVQKHEPFYLDKIVIYGKEK